MVSLAGPPHSGHTEGIRNRLNLAASFHLQDVPLKEDNAKSVSGRGRRSRKLNILPFAYKNHGTYPLW